MIANCTAVLIVALLLSQLYGLHNTQASVSVCIIAASMLQREIMLQTVKILYRHDRIAMIDRSNQCCRLAEGCQVSVLVLHLVLQGVTEGHALYKGMLFLQDSIFFGFCPEP